MPYSVDDILKDGCFLERDEIDRLLDRLRTKKNLILQGPPGTGKTWLAKRLAFALMGQKDESKVRAVQFHPNLSYEDFVRGWRPTGEGKLSLADGVFMEAIKAASKDPSSKFVVVIEEINRGKLDDVEFVIEVLKNYHGQVVLHDLFKDLIEALPEGSPLLCEISVALDSAGVVAGEFGHVATYLRKKDEIKPWLDDPREKVRAFAHNQTLGLERQIADEQRRAEQGLELRKRNYGE